eukprot:4277759-Ditylum_brightwellii.AAC.2
MTKREEVLYSKKGEKITCYTCDSNHYANKCPDTKKPAKGAIAVTVGNDGSIIEVDSWGNDEGLTGIMFCTNGVTKSYKNALMHQCFKKDHVHSMDYILQQAGGIINRN